MSEKQLRFPSLRSCRPPKPTIRSERVATAIAERIVSEVNLDDFYWEPQEIPERVADVSAEIQRGGKPATVFTRLVKRGERSWYEYRWEGIDEHCRHIADDIADEELQKAILWWRKRYA